MSESTINPAHCCTLSRTKDWFEKAVPEPQLKNFNVQLGTHCEEFVEMLDPICGDDDETNDLIIAATLAVDKLAHHLKQHSHRCLLVMEPEDEIDFLDALCDQIVTATGVAHMRGHDIIGAMCEVNDSNFSKFVDGKPIFDSNRKIIKGENYRKPILQPYLAK